jgi:hypothetical protein
MDIATHKDLIGYVCIGILLLVEFVTLGFLLWVPFHQKRCENKDCWCNVDGGIS